MVQKTRIMALINNLNIGGAETLLLNISKNIDSEKFDFSICSLFRGNQLLNEFTSEGVRTFRLNFKFLFDPVGMLRLYRLVKYKKVQILHSHLRDANMIAAIVGRMAGVHTIATIHNVIGCVEGFIPKILDYSQKYVLSADDAIVCVSEFVKRSYWGKVQNEIRSPWRRKILTIHNGVDIEAINRAIIKRTSIRNELELKDGDTILGIVARLIPWKGHNILIEAMRLVTRNYPRVKLLVIGSGPLRNQLREQVRDYNLQRNIVFLDNRIDIYPILHAIDIFVLPYNYLGLFEGGGVGLAIIEAMACGKPVITTRVPHISEAVLDGVTGLTVSQGSREELAGAILHLIKNPELARELGKNAKNLVFEKFTLQRTIQQYETLYDELCRC